MSKWSVWCKLLSKAQFNVELKYDADTFLHNGR